LKKKTFFDFQKHLLKVEIEKRAEMWLEYNSKLKFFRQRNILAEKKTTSASALLKNLVWNDECSYGFARYCWPHKFNPQSVLLLLDTIKVSNCEWSSSRFSLDHRYQCYFQIQDLSFCSSMDFCYDDPYSDEYQLESFQIVLGHHEKGSEHINETQSVKLMHFKFEDPQEPQICGHFSLDKVLEVVKTVHSEIDAKFFLHILFILSMPEDGEALYSFEQETSFDGKSMWGIWDAQLWAVIQECLLMNKCWKS